MSDFDLDNSEWYNASGIARAGQWVRNDAESLGRYVGVLVKYDFQPDIAETLSDAELALTEALLAVKLARAAYETKRPTLQAAE